jgi:hypothetical protein
MGIAILYIEELKAIMRGRFAWLGAAVILLAMGGVACPSPKIDPMMNQCLREQ